MNKIKKLENKFLEVFKETFLEKGSKLGSKVSSDYPDKIEGSYYDMMVSYGESPNWVENTCLSNLLYEKENGEIIFKCDRTSSFILEPVYYLGQFKDRVIINALIGDITLFKNYKMINFKLPDSQKIKINYNEGFSIEKLILARKLFDANKIDDKEQYCVINQYQLNNLYTNINKNSQYFSDVEKIIKGESNELLGFKFIRVRSTINLKKIVCFAKSGILYENLWEKISATLSELDNNMISINVSGTFQASRLDNKKVVEIECYEE